MEQMTTELIDGTKVNERRIAKHMTQRQLALEADVSQETVNRIERAAEGRSVFPLTARKLADALGVEVSDLRAEDNGG
jgi:transcriptional regulator with XRE-family HTH domain